MASAIIHVAIAKKVNEKLKLNNDEFLLGAIAPDTGKLVYGNRLITHFVNSNNEIDINNFLNKYSNKLDTAYEMGYYVHLLSDIYWENDFIIKYIVDDLVKYKDGLVVKTNKEELKYLLYNDYTNLNKLLIEHYNIDLSFLKKNYDNIKNDIDEISVSDVNKLLDQMLLISTRIPEDKEYILDIDPVIEFIDNVSIKILSEISNR